MVSTHQGLIPTHAGKTTDAREPAPLRWAHPHSRGENAIVVGMVREGMGSSPLTRGKHILRVLEGKAERLIPTHAGKTPPLVNRLSA